MLRTTDNEETCCHYLMGYSFQLTARDPYCAPFHRQISTFHSLWYTSYGAQAETGNSSKCAPGRIDLTTQHTMSGHCH